MDWIGLAQDRDRWRTLVSAVLDLRVPWNGGNFLTSCKPVGYSGRTLHRGVSKYTHTHTHTHKNCVDHCLLFAAMKPNGDYFMIYTRAGQLQPTLEPYNSLRTRLRTVLVFSYIEKRAGEWIELTRRPWYNINQHNAHFLN